MAGLESLKAEMARLMALPVPPGVSGPGGLDAWLTGSARLASFRCGVGIDTTRGPGWVAIIGGGLWCESIDSPTMREPSYCWHELMPPAWVEACEGRAKP